MPLILSRPNSKTLYLKHIIFTILKTLLALIYKHSTLFSCNNIVCFEQREEKNTYNHNTHSFAYGRPFIIMRVRTILFCDVSISHAFLRGLLFANRQQFVDL